MPVGVGRDAAHLCALDLRHYLRQGSAASHPQALDLHLLPCLREVAVSLAAVVGLQRKRFLKAGRRRAMRCNHGGYVSVYMSIGETLTVTFR